MKSGSRKTAVLTLLLAVLTSACGNLPSDTEAPESGKPDGTNGPPTITVGMMSTAGMKYLPGEKAEKNQVYDAYLKEAGVTVKPSWIVDPKQYDQKLKVAIAAGDLPDLFEVDAGVFQQLMEADLILDLTDIYNKNASSKTKQFLTSDGGRQLASATFEGKLMAIPHSSDPYQRMKHIWIRQDWLEKLKLPEPKTMQDLLNVSKAFTKSDPDGNGKDDTIGLAINQSFDTGIFGLTGFFNGYHAYWGQWIQNNSGKLVYGNIQPEMKAALKQLQMMFKNGEIDREYGVKDAGKASELTASGKAGIVFGEFWLGNWPLYNNAVKDNKQVQHWKVYPIVSVNDKPALHQLGLGVYTYYVVSKKSKNPEAVIQLLNTYVEGELDPFGRGKLYRDLEGGGSFGYWHLNPMYPVAQDMSVRWAKELPKAIESKDPSTLSTPLMKKKYEDYFKYKEGDLTHWGVAHELQAFTNELRYLNEKQYLFDEFYGASTKTMAEKGATLEKKTYELFTKIIMGDMHIDEFDKFVTQWKALGGDDITKEVNAWYEKARAK